MGLNYPPLDRIAVNGLADGREPLHTAERLRLAEAAGTNDKVIKGTFQRLIDGGRNPAVTVVVRRVPNASSTPSMRGETLSNRHRGGDPLTLRPQPLALGQNAFKGHQPEPVTR